MRTLIAAVRPTAPASGLAVVIAALVAAALASAAPPLGDRTAIRFYDARAAAYADLAGVEIVETGYFFVRPEGGTSVDYAWGNGRPAGYVPATGTIVARLLDGKIVAYLAKIHAPRIRSVRVLMAGGEVYSSTEGCWQRGLPTASPLGTGDAYVLNDGGARFRPLRKSGSATVTTFTYDWATDASAVETSTFAPHDPAAFSVSIAVKGAERLSVHKSVTPLRTPPKLPVPSPPGLPVPKPLCVGPG